MTEHTERAMAQYLDQMLDASRALVEHARTLGAQRRQAHQRLQQLAAHLAAIAASPPGSR